MAIELLLIIFVYCYIGSLKNSNSEYDYKVLDEEGNKMTIEEKREKDVHVVHEKYEVKRQEMKAKYGLKDNNNNWDIYFVI